MELMLDRVEKQVGAQAHLYPWTLILAPRAGRLRFDWKCTRPYEPGDDAHGL